MSALFRLASPPADDCDDISERIAALSPKPSPHPVALYQPLARIVMDELPPVLVPPFLTVRWIVEIASKVFDVSFGEIVGTLRYKEIVKARQAVCLIAHEAGRWSYPDIGRVIGGRDHSTIIHSVHTAKRKAKSDPLYAARIEVLRRAVRQAFPPRETQP